VYATPCAQHVLAFMLAWARQLPRGFDNQRGPRDWPHGEMRGQARLLEDQRVVLVGFGSIGARLAELLAPLTRNLLGVRRTARGDEGIETIAFDSPRLLGELSRADHVVNLLPGGSGTRTFFDRERLAALPAHAVFYNVGRGSTVDQQALAERLQDGQLAAALLDVTEPEPLPPDHPLWTAPNCVITPHSAGGHHDEGQRLVQHFADNLARFLRSEPVLDRAF
jgi:phosphoglycerate dehydrogenase-like enzyme